jgi:NAD(P)-dependent dehydrogenase (short-subunit alcohol dehydrogenase family)
MSVRLAFVAGASRGLGFACALEAARRGYHVVALARTVGGLEALDDAIREAGGSATLTPLDLTDDPALERLGAALHERWGALDLWLHCAAFPPMLSPAPHADIEDLDKAWAINAHAIQRLIRALDPLLRAAPAGRAVLMDDRREPQAFFGAYLASKAAARAIWTSWALETRKTDLRVVRALPPPMPTALRARFYPGENRGALTRPEAVATALFDALAEDPASGAEIDLRHLSA